MKNLEIGEKLDHLEFIEEIGRTRHGHRQGLFLCVCGKQVTRLLFSVLRKAKNPKSCGCIDQVAHGGRTKSRTNRIVNTDPTGFSQELARKFLLMNLV